MRDVTAHEVVDDWVEGAVEVGQPVRDQRLDRTFSFQQLEVPESTHSKHFLEWCDTQAKVVGRIAYIYTYSIQTVSTTIQTKGL